MKAFLNLVALTALGAAGVRADIIITLDDPNQAGSPGQTLQFFGNITNTGSDLDPVYLNGDSFNFDLSIASYTLADQFFNTVPVFLDKGASSGHIELFDVTLSISFADPFGTYGGTYGLLGGTVSALENLAQIDFSVDAVQPLAPEPATIALLGTGLALMGGLCRARRDSAAPDTAGHTFRRKA